MARLFTDREIKAIMKTLMVVWQENNDQKQLGLNMSNNLLCKVEVCSKMEFLLNNEDSFEFHLHASEWFDENIADLSKQTQK